MLTLLVFDKAPMKKSILGHMHLKVRSVSIAAFTISLAISPDFDWISSKKFLMFLIKV